MLSDKVLEIMALTDNPVTVSWSGQIQIERNITRMQVMNDLLDKIETIKVSSKEFNERLIKCKLTIFQENKKLKEENKDMTCDETIYIYNVLGRVFLNGELVEVVDA